LLATNTQCKCVTAYSPILAVPHLYFMLNLITDSYSQEINLLSLTSIPPHTELRSIMSFWAKRRIWIDASRHSVSRSLPSKVVKGSAQHDRFYVRLQLGISLQGKSFNPF